MRVTVTGSLACLGALLMACGGGDDGGPTMTNTQAASSTVSQTATVRDNVSSMNGSSAAASVQGLGAAAQGIITAAPTGTPSARWQPGPDLLGLVKLEPGPELAAGTCTCDASGCTFVACGDDQGTWTIDGSIGVSGDTYTFDLDMAYNTAGISWAWSYAGTLTLTATSISGSLSGDGAGTFDAQGTSISYSSDWSVDYDDVQLDGSGCAVGGSVTASASYSVSGTQGAGDFSGSGTVTFGPACGQATAS